MTADYYTLPTRSIGNEFLRLDFLEDHGPRIVRLLLAGSSQNLLAETPDLGWETPFGPFHLWGGHRLWHAPEATPRTSIPDDGGMEVEELADGIRLSRPAEAATGIAKAIEIHPGLNRPALTLVHILRNEGLWPVELAPWAITQLPLGGTAILPQQNPQADPKELLPDRRIVLWPYARWDDPRLAIRDDYLLIKGTAADTAFKVGLFNFQGWAAYLWQDILLCKRFTPQVGKPHPDFGCNTEVYTKDRFLELETLAPMTRLEPGEAVAHIEAWEVYRGSEVSEVLGQDFKV
jgi:hypothetical protein